MFEVMGAFVRFRSSVPPSQMGLHDSLIYTHLQGNTKNAPSYGGILRLGMACLRMTAVLLQSDLLLASWNCRDTCNEDATVQFSTAEKSTQCKPCDDFNAMHSQSFESKETNFPEQVLSVLYMPRRAQSRS